MKYLLVILLILVVFWLWRSAKPGSGQAAQPSRPSGKPSKEKETTEMVACDFCHIHLPKSEALIGRDGFYCSEAHRREAGS